MRILVTGGAGFIGSAVCRDFVLRRRWNVLNVDKLTYAANPKSLTSLEGERKYRFFQGDICDRSTLDTLFRDFAPTAVLHLPAESHVDRSITASADFIKTNVVGTYTLLEAAPAYWLTLRGEAKQDFRFHHVSADEVYGSLADNEASFGEVTPYDPRSSYSASKASSDHLVSA